jgi:DNA-binding transcriptional LysR family regulator
VVASAAHPLAAATDVTVERLAAARWATLAGEGFQRNFINFFTRRGQPLPAQSLMTDSIELIRRTVLATDMLTVLPPDMVFRRHSPNPGSDRRERRFCPPNRPIPGGETAPVSAPNPACSPACAASRIAQCSLA